MWNDQSELGAHSNKKKKNDEVVENFYTGIKDVMNLTKFKGISLLLGDRNAHV